MKSFKRFLCILLTAALLLGAPGTAMAMEGEETTVADITLGEAPDIIFGGPASEGEPEESGELGAQTPAQEELLPVQQGFAIAPGEDVSQYPVLRIAGGQHTMFYNEGTPSQTEAFNPDKTMNQENFAFVLDELRDFGIRKNWKYMEDTVIKFFWNSYGMLEMKPDGTSLDPGITCKIEKDWYEPNWLGDRNFTFDWRLDPWDIADELEVCINAVLTATGAGKVNIVGMSGSGAVLLCYLKNYGTDKLASAMFNISMHGGTTLFGDLATKKLALNTKALGHTNPLVISANEVEGMSFDPLGALFRVLYESGMLDILGKTANLGISWCLDRLYDEMIIPLFFQMPALWCQVPPAQFEQAKQMMLKGDPKYAELVRKIDRYHKEVLKYQNEIIQEAASKIKVAVRTGYGMPLYPITENSYANGDNYVDAKYASFGATCAPLDKPFPSRYEQQVPGDKNYISPDRLVDASTCALPSLTWLSRGQPHRSECLFNGWYDWFLKKEGDYSVFANPDFPQYSDYIKESEYVPLEPKPGSPVLDFIVSVGLWFLKVWRFILTAPMLWMEIPLFSKIIMWLQRNEIL